ncbi:hypothetical protein FHS68_000406 [Dyadobacter arcticus]|uniref:Uncharacterized protein n=1 Tax=Dyadobacter arcticus TaxID=1078754 RepID=A0ABX0UHS1_9BACT|nr:hypothetical protein [Dyadobacter arcticus]
MLAVQGDTVATGFEKGNSYTVDVVEKIRVSN